jgi:hypothetical protein
MIELNGVNGELAQADDNTRLAVLEIFWASEAPRFGEIGTLPYPTLPTYLTLLTLPTSVSHCLAVS